jgi:hypothetical protein
MEAINKCYTALADGEKGWLESQEHKRSNQWMKDLNKLKKQNPSMIFVTPKSVNSPLLDESRLWIFASDVNSKLKPIFDSIRESEEYFSDDNNLNEEEGLTFNSLTFKRASNFLIKYSKTILNRFNTVIDKPNIYPGPDGSIDIFWKNSSYELLLNIPSEENFLATFYGDNKNKEHIKGTINLNSEKLNNGIILFLCDPV